LEDKLYEKLDGDAGVVLLFRGIDVSSCPAFSRTQGTVNPHATFKNRSPEVLGRASGSRQDLVRMAIFGQRQR
jgi:hypothetical protein